MVTDQGTSASSVLPVHRTHRFLQPDEKVAILQAYEADEGRASIARRFHVSTTTVTELLRRSNVRMRPRKPRPRQLSLWDAAFDVVTEESAYWVGFLMADGNVYKGTITIRLKAADRHHLEAFRLFLRSGHKIGEYDVCFAPGHPLKRAVCYAFRSERIADALARFGVLPNKSKTAQVIGLESDPHFWRGVLCGDGHVSISKRGEAAIGLTGSAFLIEQFLAYTHTICDHRRGYLTAKGKRVASTSFVGRPAYLIIKALFGPCGTALPRKAEVAARILSECDPLNGNVVAVAKKRERFKLYPFRGKMLTVAELARAVGMRETTLRNRLRVMRLSIDDALSRPVDLSFSRSALR